MSTRKILPDNFFVSQLCLSSSSALRTPSMAVQGVHWMQVSVVLLLCLSETMKSAASETSRNYYDTLNVEPTATDSQIKKAFRRLAVQHHPDKNKSGDAEKTFREIAEAYTVLSNKEKRRLYDSEGHEAFLKNEATAAPQDNHDTNFHYSFEDIFHDFDDSPFVEDPFFHWSFPQDWVDEDGPYEHYSFDDPRFSFYFDDGDENEEDHHYY